MKIVKNFLSCFKIKNDELPNSKNIKKEDRSNITGQNVIYFNNFLKRNKYLKIFLSLLSILLFSFILIISSYPTLTDDELYIKNFEYSVYNTYRSGNNISLPYSYLCDSNFQMSYKLYDKIKDSSNLNRYYYAISAMKIGEHHIAQQELIILKNEDNLFVDDAQWLLALSFLKTNKEKAILEFKLISNNKNHYKHTNAEKILKMLK